MRRLSLATLLAAALALPGFAQDADERSPVEVWQADPTTVFEATDVVLDDFLWIARPVVVFADTPADPAFGRQVELLAERANELALRDVVVITDSSRAEPSEIRKKLRPRGFQLTLIDKNGGVILRKPFPWSVRELSRQIDKLPLRKQEIRDRLTTE